MLVKYKFKKYILYIVDDKFIFGIFGKRYFCVKLSFNLKKIIGIVNLLYNLVVVIG